MELHLHPSDPRQAEATGAVHDLRALAKVAATTSSERTSTRTGSEPAVTTKLEDVPIVDAKKSPAAASTAAARSHGATTQLVRDEPQSRPVRAAHTGAGGVMIRSAVEPQRLPAERDHARSAARARRKAAALACMVSVGGSSMVARILLSCG